MLWKGWHTTDLRIDLLWCVAHDPGGRRSIHLALWRHWLPAVTRVMSLPGGGDAPASCWYGDVVVSSREVRGVSASVLLACLTYPCWIFLEVLDDRGSRVRFPVGAGNFSLYHRVQRGSGAHPTSYPMGTRGSFPGGKAAGVWSWPLVSI
jgi:hypothetical protein